MSEVIVSSTMEIWSIRIYSSKIFIAEVVKEISKYLSLISRSGHYVKKPLLLRHFYTFISNRSMDVHLSIWLYFGEQIRNYF